MGSPSVCERRGISLFPKASGCSWPTTRKTFSPNCAEMKIIGYWPLTLTLSGGERGQLRCGGDFPGDRSANPTPGDSKTLGMFLPLPGGEGRGEGGRKTQI